MIGLQLLCAVVVRKRVFMTPLDLDNPPQFIRQPSQPLGSRVLGVVQRLPEDLFGASKLTSEVTNIIAQVPPVIEAMTGIKLQDLMKSVPGLGKPAIDVSPINGAEAAAPSVENAPTAAAEKSSKS